MFRITIELPFDVLIVHRKVFRTQEAAGRYARRHYKRFPAVEVRTGAAVEAWAGTLFLFPAHWKRKK